jgi:hypothetical protein
VSKFRSHQRSSWGRGLPRAPLGSRPESPETTVTALLVACVTVIHFVFYGVEEVGRNHHPDQIGSTKLDGGFCLFFLKKTCIILHKYTVSK